MALQTQTIMSMAFPSLGNSPDSSVFMSWLRRYCKAFAIANCRRPNFLQRLFRVWVSVPGKRDKSRP